MKALVKVEIKIDVAACLQALVALIAILVT